MTGTSLAVEEQLVFDEHQLIHIHNGGYQFIDVQTFVFPDAVDDRAVIELLIGHVRYRHGYASPEYRDAKLIHGPYWLAAISWESFSAVSAVAAEALISTWANYDAVVPDSDYPRVERQVFGPMREASSIYQLADLRASAEHDWGGDVVGLTGFHEFVVINRQTRILRLIVATDD